MNNLTTLLLLLHQGKRRSQLQSKAEANAGRTARQSDTKRREGDQLAREEKGRPGQTPESGISGVRKQIGPFFEGRVIELFDLCVQIGEAT